MTTDELNAIIQAVMLEMEKAGVDFDFKAETPQPTDLVYVMRGTADKYQGITVKWQNLLDIIVQKATEAKDDAISAKDIALQTLATIQGIESNVNSMKSSVETTKGEVETLKSDVATMKASVETSEANVTQMKSDVSGMKTSVEGTKTEVENIKEETAGLLATKADVTYVDGELATKVSYTDSLSYKEIMATTDLTNKVASANALKEIATLDLLWTNASPTSEFKPQTISLDLRGYSLVIVKAKRNTNNTVYYNNIFKIGDIGGRLVVPDDSMYFRIDVSVKESGVTFGSGYLNTTIDNTKCIPYKIYGVK